MSSSSLQPVKLKPGTCQDRAWNLSGLSLELVTFEPGTCQVRAWGLPKPRLERGKCGSRRAKLAALLPVSASWAPEAEAPTWPLCSLLDDPAWRCKFRTRRRNLLRHHVHRNRCTSLGPTKPNFGRRRLASCGAQLGATAGCCRGPAPRDKARELPVAARASAL